MEYNLEELKEAVKRFEKSIHAYKDDDVEKYSQLIANIAEQIKSEYWQKYVEKDQIQILPKYSHDAVFKRINEIKFLYKPMFLVDIYEGNEIEFYVKERTEELMESASLDSHNEFWQDHQSIYGNVYGSVPKELLSEHSIIKLKKCGWHEVNVDIFEMNADLTGKALRAYVEKQFRHYVIVKEMATETILVLRYHF